MMVLQNNKSYVLNEYCLMHHNFIGSIHGDSSLSPKHPFGTTRAELTYAVGTSLLHKKGLKLYNPKTKRDIIRGIF